MSFQTKISQRNSLIMLFPDYSEEISLFLSKYENSIELVDDYLFCRKEYKRLLDSNKAELAVEFELTTRQLEEELMEQLNHLRRQHINKINYS